MSDAALGMRTKVEAAVMSQAELIGPRGFDRKAIIRTFRDHVPVPTLYRWIDQVLKSGAPGQHVARLVKSHAAERAARSPDPAGELAAEAAAVLPVRVGIADVVQLEGRCDDVIDQIGECVRAAQQVLKYARTTEGGVRAPKLLLAAADSMRRGLETAVKLQAALNDGAENQRFIDDLTATIRDVAREHPAAAELLLGRIKATARRWS